MKKTKLLLSHLFLISDPSTSEPWNSDDNIIQLIDGIIFQKWYNEVTIFSFSK